MFASCARMRSERWISLGTYQLFVNTVEEKGRAHKAGMQAPLLFLKAKRYLPCARMACNS